MKATDYEAIAPRYDRNPLRHSIPADERLGAVILGAPQAVVVDLACGTGNYLAAQRAAYGPGPRWVGIDRSEAMLAQARGKVADADWIRADAADLPLASASADFVKVRFAHHHFEDRPRAFAEVFRVLKAEGQLSVYNICHEYSRRPWVYHYFPETRDIDAGRFPSVLEFHGLLTDLGFAVDTAVEVRVTDHAYADLLAEARNRDMSQLTLLDDRAYDAGLAALEDDARRGASFRGDVALVTFHAVKPAAG